MLCVCQLMMDVIGTIHVLHGKGFVVVITRVEISWNLLSFVVVQLQSAQHLHYLFYLTLQSHQESACTVMASVSGLVSDVLKNLYRY